MEDCNSDPAESLPSPVFHARWLQFVTIAASCVSVTYPPSPPKISYSFSFNPPVASLLTDGDRPFSKTSATSLERRFPQPIACFTFKEGQRCLPILDFNFFGPVIGWS